MKNLLSVLLAALMIVCVFAGCTSDKNDENTSLHEGQVTTENAKIKGNEAVHFIEDCYTLEELGLADVAEEFRFMVDSNGYVYDGDNYICVVANVITQKEGVTADDGSPIYDLKSIGEYLISFDGRKVLKKDMTSEDTYTELENRMDEFNKNKEQSTSSSAEAE